MEVKYRVSLEGTDEQVSWLAERGVELEAKGRRVYHVFSDAHPNWDEISDQLKVWGCRVILRYNEFTRAEVDAAKWAVFSNFDFLAYPDGKGDDWLERAFDVTAYCPVCGVGAVQRHPFTVTTRPRWGKRGVGALHWLSGEIMLSSEGADRVHRELGMECREVLDGAGRPHEDLWQLVIRNEVALDMREGFPALGDCGACGVMSYPAFFLGLQPPLKAEPEAPIVRGDVWIQPGLLATKPLIVGQKAVQVLRDLGARGPGHFLPVVE